MYICEQDFPAKIRYHVKTVKMVIIQSKTVVIRFMFIE
jgi:hypothetical protein